MKNLQDPWWWASVLVTVVFLVLSVPFLLFLVPLLHYLRNSTKRIIKAEYRYRQRTRNWNGYDASFPSPPPLKSR